MVLLPTSTLYIQQSNLLISARPTTTRITTHYSLPRSKPRTKPLTKPRGKSKVNHPTTTSASAPPPSSSSSAGPNTHPNPNPNPKTVATATSNTQQVAPQAILTLKTYDPVSGVVLKYRTNRAAEVGRLMAGLLGLGEVMAGSGFERGSHVRQSGVGGVEGDERDEREGSVAVVTAGPAAGGVGGGGPGEGKGVGKEKGKGKKKGRK